MKRSWTRVASGFLAGGVFMAMNRRICLWITCVFACLPPPTIAGAATNPPVLGRASLIEVDYRKLVSRADLDYNEPVRRSEEGMPVGNGRMGSLVWTSPSALKLQINRVDVFAVDGSTVSFPQADSDYAGVCGYVDINLAAAGDDVFTPGFFKQRLCLYDALMTAQGRGVTARVLAWPARDVMAVEIDDQRSAPEPINVDLRMLRYQIQRITGRNFELASRHAVQFQTAEHSAASILDIRDRRITLTQQFREGDFYDSSAVAIAVCERQSRARYLNESCVQLSAAPGRGRFTILIAGAASFDPMEDTAALALNELDAAAAKGFDVLAGETADWWHDFWAGGFVYMHSSSSQADFVEANYTYFLYLMGASSRGDYPPRFGGMLWYTNGDMRRWGSQYWWANTSAYYSNLMPANRIELMAPMFSMYFNMKDACALAARQQWDSQGIWIPEICWFNGPEPLPEDLIGEIQELFLARKPYEQRSERFQWWAETKNRHNSRWNFQADGKWDHGHFVVPTKAAVQPDRFGSPEINGIFGHCTHIFSGASRIGSLFYQRYQFTLDKEWLRDRAYPIIRGAAEFYRNFPNLQKGDDGKYHIHHVNNVESSWNSSDTSNEVDAMHMIFPLAIHVSQVLGVDAEMRPIWQEIKDNLMPQRTDRGGGRRRVYGSFVYGGPGAIEPIGPEPDLKRRFLGFNALGSFIDSKGAGGAQILRNRLRLREGPGAIDAEHIGGLAMGIHSTMLDSSPASTTNDEPIRILNDWPKDWDAAFSLLARGGFVVSSAHIDGQIPLVQIKSLMGGQCLLRNPWGDTDVTLYRNANKAEDLSGETLTFQMQKEETIVVVPKGSKPSRIRVL